MPGSRTLLLSAPRSFCAGVERAIAVVEQALAERGQVHVRRQIVHNTRVVADLERRGAIFVDEVDQIPAGSTVVFAAHGVAPQVREQARQRRLTVIDATCPLVAKVHAEARRSGGRGDTLVVIGHAEHEEIQGVLGEAAEGTVLVESVEDVARIAVPDPSRVSYLTQTTLAMDETAGIAAALRARFPGIRPPGSADICYASTNRQQALAAITDEADVVLVVGSANSSNSVRLAELAARRGVPAYLIDGASEIQDAWIRDAEVIGLTAGASAPPAAVDEVIARLAPAVIEEREFTRETVQFLPPIPEEPSQHQDH